MDFNGYYQQTINKECKLLIDIVTLLHTLQNCRTVFLDYFPKHMLDDCFYSGEETQQGSEHVSVAGGAFLDLSPLLDITEPGILMEVSLVQPPVRDLYGDQGLDGRVGGGGATRNVDVERLTSENSDQDMPRIPYHCSC